MRRSWGLRRDNRSKACPWVKVQESRALLFLDDGGLVACHDANFVQRSIGQRHAWQCGQENPLCKYRLALDGPDIDILLLIVANVHGGVERL